MASHWSGIETLREFRPVKEIYSTGKINGKIGRSEEANVHTKLVIGPPAT